MFQKIAKHRANDASNDVHRPPLHSRRWQWINSLLSWLAKLTCPISSFLQKSSKRILVTDRRSKLSLDAKAVHPAWYLPTTLTTNSKTWAGPYWRDCWVVGAAGSNAALWQLLYLGAGNGNGTPRVSSDQTDLRIKCLAWATFRNRTWGCSILWGQNGSVNSDDEESRFTARKLNSFVERSLVVN